MAETADVVILGTGFAGASTAYHLGRRGTRNAVLLEAEATPGYHASGRNAALAFQVLGDLAEAQLAVEGARFIAEPPEGFCDTPLLRRCGSLLVAQASGLAGLERSARAAAELGIEGSLLSDAEARRRVSLLADAPIAGAFWNPGDGVVDIHALLQSYLAGARRAGMRSYYREPAVAIDVENGRVVRVRTAKRQISTPMVVNGAGAWAGEVGRLAGVGTRTMQPRRRHLFQTRIHNPIDPSWPFVWHNDIDVYFRPESGGLLTSPCDATPHEPREPELDGAAAEMLFEKLRRAFPSLADASVVSSWACLRTFARDEHFVIGPDPEVEGLIWVAGLGGHGMTTSPAVGRLGAAAVLGEKSEQLEGFSPARLAG